MAGKEISLIIPHYNYIRYLNEAIASAVAQKDDLCEILVIDDCSGEFPQNTIFQYPQATFYINSQNRGLAAIRNQGCDLAKGDWLFYLDADDILSDGIIKKIVGLETDADILYGDMRVFGNVSAVLRPNPAPTLADFARNNQIYSGSFIRKALCEKIGGWTEVEAEDWDFWIRAMKAGAKFQYVPEIFYQKREHDTNKWNREMGRAEEIRQKILKRNRLE